MVSRYAADLNRVCPVCSTEFTISQDTLQLKPYGAVEKCPGCGRETGILGEYQEEAIGIKLHGRS